MKYIYKNLKTKLYYKPNLDTDDLYKAYIFYNNSLYSPYHKYERLEFNQELKNIRKKKLLKIHEKQ